jgi:hypothetical protein
VIVKLKAAAVLGVNFNVLFVKLYVCSYIYLPCLSDNLILHVLGVKLSIFAVQVVIE